VGARRIDMKALSFTQPWAWFIAEGIKDIENRTWEIKHRGTILIHASKRWDPEGEGWLDMNISKGRLPIKEYPDRHDPRVIYGALIGRVDIVDCVEISPSLWFCGPKGFVLRNPIKFEKPIIYKGRLGLFEVDESILRRGGLFI
jgi:hypothetical protein